MKFDQLYQILVIEEKKSISKAAKSLYMGQSTLSGALNSLESEINVRIFNRTSNGVTITPEGKEILSLAKKILEYQNQMLNYSVRKNDFYGEVTVLMTHAYSFLYSDIMFAFKNTFPNAKLNLKVEMSENILQALSTGLANIGITLWEFLPEQTDEFLREKGIAYEPYSEHELVVFASQDNKLADSLALSPDDIKEESFVSYSMPFWQKTNLILNANKEPLVVSEIENLKRMINTGQAIAVLPDTFALHDLYCEQGMIKVIPLENSGRLSHAVDYLLYPVKRKLTLLEQKVLEMLREILKKYPIKLE